MPKIFSDGINFMSMFNDIELDRAGHEQMCINNAQQVADVSKDFKPGRWCHIRRGSEQSWNCGTNADSREKWDAIAEEMTDIFAQ